MMNEPIAIVGIGCRFPGDVHDTESFWQLLVNEVDAIAPMPAGRFDTDAYYDPIPAAPGKIVTRDGGFIESIDKFDAEFFGISSYEARHMDPQQRLLLEVAWESFENANLVPAKLAGSKTGVFVGMWTSDYETLVYDSSDNLDLYITTGLGRYSASGRLSFMFDLHGPSMTLDTACSSSLVAVHLACQSLREGQSDMAVAGGANLIIAPQISIGYSRSGMLSPDARCKFGDASANGYVRSEGVGVIVLKRLSDALADGDPIRAVIRGSSVNNDGKSGKSLVAPGVTGQIEMLRAAYDNAGVRPGDVGYVEAHGTGTRVGDPVELQALGAVLSEGRHTDNPCWIGSIKSNIGHTEAASGIAGIIKAVLCLERGEIPVTLHVHEPNPNIPWAELPFQLATKRVKWASSERRYAGVNSFGVTGTNAHIVLESAPDSNLAKVTQDEKTHYLLPLSAQKPEAVTALMAEYQSLLRNETLNLNDLIYTASAHRTHHDYRAAFVGQSATELADQIANWSGTLSSASPRKVVFVFPGQGAQWIGMGRQLYAQEPAFREALERCANALRPYIDWDLLDILLHNEDPAQFERIEVVQPALFAIQVALAEVWCSLGVMPDAIIGHSMGEVAAAYIAGSLSLEDAAAIISQRSELMKRVSGQGAMVMVELPFAEAKSWLNGYADRVDVAVTNSPRSCVLSGEPTAVAEITASLENSGVFCRTVKVNVAAHSPQMDALRPELVQHLNGLQPASANVPVYSTVTGELRHGTDFDADYWGANLRQPVLFAQAVERALEDGYNTFIEISPHPVLLSGIERSLPDYGLDDERATSILTVASTRRNEDEWSGMLNALGSLYVKGFSVDWSRLYPQAGNAIQVPAYPWQRDSYWIETQVRRHSAVPDGQHPLLGHYTRSAVQPDNYFWQTTIDLAVLPYLSDHRVEDNIILPAAAFAEMAMAALAEISGGGQLEAMTVQQALVLSETDTHTVQVAITADLGDTFAFRILSRLTGDEGGDWTLHASGILRTQITTQAESFSLEELQSRCTTPVSQADHYQAMQKRGLNYGPAFQVVERFWQNEAQPEALASLQLAETRQIQAYQIAPTLLDGCFQMLVALLPQNADTYLPVSMDQICLYKSPASASDLWGYAFQTALTDDDATGDVFLLDADGDVILSVYGLRLQRVKRAAKSDPFNHLLYHLEWQEKPLTEAVSTYADNPGSWVLLADDADMTAGLMDQLEAHGEHALLVSTGENYRQLATNHYTLRLDAPENFKRLLRDIRSAGWPACRGVVYIAAASETPADGCLQVMQLVQAMEQAESENPPQLWLVTQGTQAVDGTVANVADAALWGLGAVIANEHSELRPVRLDLDPAYPIDTTALFQTLWLNEGEDQIALRENQRYVARLVSGLPVESDASARLVQSTLSAEQPFRAEMATPGILDSLELRAMERTQPAAGQVEIEVRAVGLNFMNVLSALGAYPGYANGVGPLGIECSGVVSAIGEGVSSLQIGDEVIAVASSTFASHALADAHLAILKPANLSFVEAASIPIIFLTAYYSLFYQGRLEAHERVLIHAATGGVGLAAVQLAQQAQAEIYATAGSPEKRAYLKALGVEHIMDSRSLSFADETLRLTEGEGVDMVLNSLAGEAIAKGLAILRPYGRFVEIGKRDIYENRQVGLFQFQKNLSYFAVDLDRMSRERPAVLGRMLQELVTRFENGELTPIPIEVFPMDEAADAFRYMAQAKHIGKIVLERPDRPLPITVSTSAEHFIREDGTYLITGGLGGLGLTVAGWLAAKGARHLVLTARRGASESAQMTIRELEAQGVTVEIAQGDIADAEAVAAMLQTIDQSMPPLRGVIHAAGILDDSLLGQMTEDQFRRVLSPKVDGAWNLHTLTDNHALDVFVLFSSVTALLGTPGQGNYAAGNAFMDALAYFRRAKGLPALSINWGPWSEVGLAAAASIRGQRLASRGLGSLSPEEGITLLDSFMSAQVPPQVAVMAFDVQDWAGVYTASAKGSLLVALQQEAVQTEKPREEVTGDFRQALKNTEPGRQRRTLFENHIREQIAQVLHIEAARIGLHQPLRELGIDSLLTLELRNRLESVFKLTLSATVIFNYPTIAVLSTYLADKLNMPLDEVVETAPPVPANPEPESSELDELSQAEIEAMLEDELKSIDDLLKGN